MHRIAPNNIDVISEFDTDGFYVISGITNSYIKDVGIEINDVTYSNKTIITDINKAGGYGAHISYFDYPIKVGDKIKFPSDYQASILTSEDIVMQQKLVISHIEQSHTFTRDVEGFYFADFMTYPYWQTLYIDNVPYYDLKSFGLQSYNLSGYCLQFYYINKPTKRGETLSFKTNLSYGGVILY